MKQNRIAKSGLVGLGLFLAVGQIGVGAQTTIAPPPALISFQGRLARPDGTPVTDGNAYAITFSLWDAAAGGVKRWEQTFTGVTVRNGAFAILLDLSASSAHFTTGNTLDSTLNNNTYLQIQVGTDPALTPRQQLVSNAYALKAATIADGAISISKLTSDVRSGLLGGATAGGDLTGAYPNPTLATKASSLAKVSGNALTSDGTNLGIVLNAYFAVNPTDKFTYSSKSIGTNSLGWYSDPWNTFGGTAWLSGYSGIKLFTGNATTPRLSLTAGGSIGIGTASPVAPLHLIGNFRATGKALIGANTTLDTPANYAEALVVDGATRLFGDLRVDGTNGLSLLGTGAGITFPDGSKQTSAPSTTAGGDLTGTYPNPTIAAGKVTNTKLASDAASLNKVSGGAMTSSSGNIGIGIATPTVPLSVNTSGQFAALFQGNSAVGTWLRLQSDNSARAYDLITSASANGEGAGKLLFRDGTYGTRMTLDGANGRLGINTASPAYELDVAGTGRFTGNVRAGGTLTIGSDTGSYNTITAGNTNTLLLYNNAPGAGTYPTLWVENKGGGPAGYFKGALTATAKNFIIDDPVDPENKYLVHGCVESDERRNMYDGTVTLDDKGEVTVQMPEWFQALNKDCRYQLTCIGGYAQVYIAEKMKNNRFKIAGGKPGLEISWLVTGIRQDAWAKANPMAVEQDKGADRGKYLTPEAFGLSASRGGAMQNAQPKLAYKPDAKVTPMPAAQAAAEKGSDKPSAGTSKARTEASK